MKRSYMPQSSKPMKRTGFRIRLDAAKNSCTRSARSFRLRRVGKSQSGGTLKRRHRSQVEINWIAKVRENDNFTCRWPKCGYYSKHIHAHHIHTRAQRPDLKWDESNGACLCPYHHDYAHHTVAGRKMARELELLGTKSRELAMKEARKAA